MKIDFAFPHEYTLEENQQIPGLETRYFSAQSARETSGGLTIVVRPSGGSQWLGVFEEGYASGSVISGAYSCPSPDYFCLVSSGSGYIVNARNPDEFERVPTFPIVHVLPGPEEGLLVFADFTKACAYDRNGLRWATRSLSWDGLRNLRLQGRQLLGEGWDSPGAAWSEFTVELQSGEAHGSIFVPD